MPRMRSLVLQRDRAVHRAGGATHASAHSCMTVLLPASAAAVPPIFLACPVAMQAPLTRLDKASLVVVRLLQTAIMAALVWHVWSWVSTSIAVLVWRYSVYGASFTWPPVWTWPPTWLPLWLQHTLS